MGVKGVGSYLLERNPIPLYEVLNRFPSKSARFRGTRGLQLT